MLKYYKIADLNVEMETFGRTLKQASKYEIAKPDVVDIKINQIKDRIIKEYPFIDEDSLEYVATERDFYNKLLDFNGFKLHSSAVVVDNKAYLFSANSGVGKSTHTSLWLKAFKDAYILNDDKPALRLIDHKWYVYGTPWSGKTELNKNVKVPLAAIAFIDRSLTNSIESYQGKEVFRRLLEQSNRPFSTDKRLKLMNYLEHIYNNVPIYNLKCNKDISSALMSYEVMSKGVKNV